MKTCWTGIKKRKKRNHILHNKTKTIREKNYKKTIKSYNLPVLGGELWLEGRGEDFSGQSRKKRYLMTKEKEKNVTNFTMKGVNKSFA